MLQRTIGCSAHCVTHEMPLNPVSGGFPDRSTFVGAIQGDNWRQIRIFSPVGEALVQGRVLPAHSGHTRTAICAAPTAGLNWPDVDQLDETGETTRRAFPGRAREIGPHCQRFTPVQRSYRRAGS
jgi:hypothetical protein